MKKFKTFMACIIPIFAMFEGIDHLILSSISYWGFAREHLALQSHWMIWINPLADTLFGFMSIASSIYMRAMQKGKNQ